jgi:argininosuccinate lyase
MSSLLKGGRLGSVRKDVIDFTSSLQSDKRLLRFVVSINKAHVVMMMEKKIVDGSTSTELLQALNELDKGMRIRPGIEDIHLAIEEEVTKRVGSEVGGNLHIGKSRNDQVSTAIRMALRENLIDMVLVIAQLQETLVEIAAKNLKTVIPGFTHLQPAQPVTFAHYLLSYNDMLERSLNRLQEDFQRVNLCTMGAGALATSSFPLARERVAALLGFNGILENSIDAVSSRDFILETLADLTMIAVDVSRLTEDLIVWGSPDFGIIEFPDDFSSTSSIMPQKKNPDVLEVIRARMSHVIGSFITAVMIMKSLPSSYNMDMQEVTPRLWEALQDISSSLRILSKFMVNLKVNKDVFKKPSLSFSTSTELVNMLTRKYGVPFRTAHKIVGALTRCLIVNGLTLTNVTSELIQTTAKDLGVPSLDVKTEDIHLSIDPLRFVEAHNVRGGPSPIEVRRMIQARKNGTATSKKWAHDMKSKLAEADENLQVVSKSYSADNRQPSNNEVSGRK